MSESNPLKTLAGSKAAVNRAAKPLSPSELQSLISHLSDALDAVKKREAAKEQKKKSAALKKLQAMMKESGLSPADVAKLAGAADPAKKRGRKPAAKKKAAAKVAPKYQITVDGKAHQWTGRGRTPVVFREHIEKGGSLEDCLIK